MTINQKGVHCPKCGFLCHRERIRSKILDLCITDDCQVFLIEVR